VTWIEPWKCHVSRFNIPGARGRHPWIVMMQRQIFQDLAPAEKIPCKRIEIEFLRLNNGNTLVLIVILNLPGAGWTLELPLSKDLSYWTILWPLLVRIEAKKPNDGGVTFWCATTNYTIMFMLMFDLQLMNSNCPCESASQKTHVIVILFYHDLKFRYTTPYEMLISHHASP